MNVAGSLIKIAQKEQVWNEVAEELEKDVKGLYSSITGCAVAAALL